MTVENKNIGDKISLRRAGSVAAVTAGGAGDNTLVTGVIIDRAALGWPQSVVAMLGYTTTLGAAATLTLGWVLQHGDAANLSDVTTLTSGSSVVATGAGTFAAQLENDLSLAGAKRYVRLNQTPDLSAANTDTASVSSAMAFGGAGRLPQ